MGNKLKDVFSDKMYDLGGTIRFENAEAYEKFLLALKNVQDEGKSVEVSGVSALTTELRYGKFKYPFKTQEHITQFIIAPSKHDIPFTLNTEYGQRTFVFQCYSTTEGTILETEERAIVYIKVEFIKNTPNITFSYKTQFNLAKTVTDIVISLSTANALLDKLFKHEEVEGFPDEYALIRDTRAYFSQSKRFFKRLLLVEQALQISFNPTIESVSKSDEDEIEELYLLLIEKRVIRLNAKLTSTEATGITLRPTAKIPKIGSPLDLTFCQGCEYVLYGENFSIYKASLLTNAIFNEIIEQADGTTKILYRDTDSNPMYISYTGFKTMEEAKREMSSIMEHKEVYTNAQTLRDCLREAEESKQ